MAAAPEGLSTAQLQIAYGFSSISFNGTAGTGSGEAIAIVDAYDDLNIQSDLNTVDSYFGLLATMVSRVNETGETTDDAYFEQAGVAFVASLGRQQHTRLVAGGFAERAVRRRHCPHPGWGQCLVERGRLVRKRWGPEPLRVATVIPDRCGHANVIGTSHPGRRL